ncbi:hypothetical protein [Chitinophaga polysaccharea]|uniref:hypothetical protein n=1 Tax=Chitinophaga polysaccharea TaxID=1293035 RepID=UPI001158B0C8|nr:hypothetical protein [Chitinophaga polysaccharea]
MGELKKRRKIFTGLLLCFLCLIKTTVAQKYSESEPEISKLLDLIDSERKELRKESCPDCSYITLIKLTFKKNELDSVSLSYSTPLSLLPLADKIKKLQINWKAILKKAGGKQKIILPVIYLNNRSGGSVLFADGNDLLKGMFEFEKGDILSIKEAMYWWSPVWIITDSGAKEGKMVPDSTQLHR